MEKEKKTSKYFKSIYGQLSTIEDEASWVDEQMQAQLQLLKMDVNFLKSLCLCLETCDYANEDEKINRLRSMIYDLWSKEDKGLSLLKQDEEYISIQDFHLAKLELEAKIQHSKKHVESFCENWMHSSLQWFNCSSFFYILRSLEELGKNLKDFSSYGADKSFR